MSTATTVSILTACPACGAKNRIPAPEVHKLARARQGRAIVLKLNTEAHPTVAARYLVQSIPNFIVFKDGAPVHQQAGVAGMAEMQRWVEAAARR